MSENPVIQTHGLTKYFGGRPAVYELNLEVPAVASSRFWAATVPAKPPPSGCSWD